MNAPQIDVAFVASRLKAVGPIDLAAPALLARLLAKERSGEIEPQDVIDAQGQIQKAIAELEAHVDSLKGLVHRCQNLQPSSTTRTPPGF